MYTVPSMVSASKEQIRPGSRERGSLGSPHAIHTKLVLPITWGSSETPGGQDHLGSLDKWGHFVLSSLGCCSHFSSQLFSEMILKYFIFNCVYRCADKCAQGQVGTEASSVGFPGAGDTGRWKAVSTLTG